jgi:hypothetical protein
MFAVVPAYQGRVMTSTGEYIAVNGGSYMRA